MDRLDAMRAFVAVAEHGGFALAARQLGVSPPTITRLVAHLEGALAIPLFARTTRSVRLTDGGVRYLERARRILADVEEAEQLARSEHTTPIGRLVISAPTVFGRREVAPLASALVERHPQLAVELVLSDRIVDLVEENVDVAVRIGPLADSTLRARLVGATRRVVVASPGFLAKGKAIRTPADLAGRTTIQLAPLALAPEWRFVRAGKEHRVAIQPAFVTNSADAAALHAERGGGLAMVLAYQVRDRIAAGALEVVLASYEPPPLPIHLVYPGARDRSAALRAFIDLAVTRDWSFTDLPRRSAALSSRGGKPRGRAGADRDGS